MKDRRHIVLTDHTSFGQPRIVESRLTVGEAVYFLHGGLRPLKDFQEVYPNIPINHLVSAIRYCMAQKCRQDIKRWNTPKTPLHFCYNCSMSQKARMRCQDEPHDVWVLAQTVYERLVLPISSDQASSDLEKREPPPG